MTTDRPFAIQNRRAKTMYLPALFVEADRALTLRIMRENPLANVVTHGIEPFANAFPTVATDDGGVVTIRFHMAIRNPQVRDLEAGCPCLILYMGPNCYVSPTWYTEQPNVPSWNYLSVHAYGAPEVLDEPELERLLVDLTDLHEPAVGGDWRYEDLPTDFKRELLAEIRGFRVTVTRLESKAKLSQNRLPIDRSRVAERLLASHDAQARAVGTWMVAKLGRSE